MGALQETDTLSVEVEMDMLDKAWDKDDQLSQLPSKECSPTASTDVPRVHLVFAAAAKADDDLPPPFIRAESSAPMLEASHATADVTTNSRRSLKSTLRAVRQSKTSILLVSGWAMAVDMFLFAVVAPFLPIYAATHFDADATIVGLLFATFNIGAVLANPLFGVIADNPRFGRRRPMLIALLALTAATLCYGVATQLWMLFVARFIQGVASAGTHVISLTLVADVYPIDEAGSKVAILMSCQAVGALIAPVVGGVIYDQLSYVSVFILCAGLVMVDFVGRLVLIDESMVQRCIAETHRLNQEVIAHRDERLSAERDERDGIALHQQQPASAAGYTILHMLLDKEIMFSGVANFLIGIVFSAAEPITALYLSDRFGLNSTLIGLESIAIAVPYVVTSVALGTVIDKLVYRNKLLMAGGLLLFAIAMSLLGYSAAIWSITLSFMLFGVALGAAQPPLIPEVSEYLQMIGQVKSQAQGMALFNTFFTAGAAVGGMLGGLLYQQVGWFYTMLLFGMLCAGYALLTVGFCWLVPDATAVHRASKRAYEQQRLAAAQAEEASTRRPSVLASVCEPSAAGCDSVKSASRSSLVQRRWSAAASPDVRLDSYCQCPPGDCRCTGSWYQH